MPKKTPGLTRPSNSLRPNPQAPTVHSGALKDVPQGVQMVGEFGGGKRREWWEPTDSGTVTGKTRGK